MIEKILAILKKNPKLEYVAISWYDWDILCAEVRALSDKEEGFGEWHCYWNGLLHSPPKFGRVTILINEKIHIM